MAKSSYITKALLQLLFVERMKDFRFLGTFCIFNFRGCDVLGCLAIWGLPNSLYNTDI
jgi:hypothetical protein